MCALTCLGQVIRRKALIPRFMSPLTAELSTAERQYYARQMLLPELGVAGQERLKAARVLVVGAGGLGCPALQYLAGAGVGHIGIVDGDRVALHNLHRQVLYTRQDVGRWKVEVAAERLGALNPYVRIEPHPVMLTRDRALSLVADYDVVLDGSDNFATRYLVNDACCVLGRPWVYGAIYRYEGQVAVFNAEEEESGVRSLHYRELYPEPPAPGSVPDCATSGVLGVLPGIVGSWQAMEVIKLLTGIGTPLRSQLLIFDARTMATQRIRIPVPQPRVVVAALMDDYAAWCGDAPMTQISRTKSFTMKEVTVQQLKALMDSGADFQLIDVRELHELEISKLDAAEHIPLGDVPAQLERVSRDKDVIVMCRTGGRSGNIVRFLEQAHGFDNLYNLAGGINAYAREVDASLPLY